MSDLDTRPITLPRSAVRLLLSAGRAVYRSAQTLQQRGHTGYDGLDRQWELAEALETAERALLDDDGAERAG